MTSQTRNDEHVQRNLWAVASAVYVAVTRDIDNPDGGHNPVEKVSDTAALKQYVESYLDGYEVTEESLLAAIREGVSLTERTLQELISQAAVVEIDIDDFFADGEFDIEAGIASAASFAEGAKTSELSIREQVFAEWQHEGSGGPVLFVKPGESWSSVGLHEVAREHILTQGLPATTPYFGWGGDRDALRPDGTFKNGEDRQEVFWWGDADLIKAHLQRAEQFGYVVEGGEERSRFRLVSATDPSSTELYVLPDREDLLSGEDSFDAGALCFATSWVEKKHAPKTPDDQLTEAEARELYASESRMDFFVFPDTSAGVIPAWSMKVRPDKKSVVVTHYHRPSGSVARIMNLKYSRVFFRRPEDPPRDPSGSLSRDSTVDYFWPVDHVKYAPKSRAVRTVTLRDITDAPEIIREDKATGVKVVTKHRDSLAGNVPVAYPYFGEWGSIVDPRFGEAEDPQTVARYLIDWTWDQRRLEVWNEAGD